MKSFSLKNNDRTLNKLGFTGNAMPFSKPKLYPKNTKITFPFLYLWQNFLVPIKDLFNGSKFWHLYILIHIIAIRMRYKNMLMTTRSSYNGGLLYCISELNTDNDQTAQQHIKIWYFSIFNIEISPSKRRSKQVTYSRAVNSPMSSNIENW